jgi:hypothetical protein
VCSDVHTWAAIPHFWQNFQPGLIVVPHAHVIDAGPESRVPQAVQTAHDGSTGWRQPGHPAGPIAMRSPQPGQKAEFGASVIEQRGHELDCPRRMPAASACVMYSPATSFAYSSLAAHSVISLAR